MTISSIRRLNPSIKKDVVLIGQKLKLPGKIDVSAVAPAAPSAKAAVAGKTVARKGFAPYVGATREYVVKNGDTLGSVAYGNGLNIRQLKELNKLSSDSLKIGQKLKIPAGKTAKAEPAKEKSEPVAAAKKSTAAESKGAEPAPIAEAASGAETAPVAEAAATASAAAEAPAAAAEVPVEAKAEAVATTTYVVQEGDDMTGVSIRWGVSAAEIRELNNLTDGDKLVPGQIIKLPADAQQ